MLPRLFADVPHLGAQPVGIGNYFEEMDFHTSIVISLSRVKGTIEVTLRGLNEYGYNSSYHYSRFA